MNKALEIYLNKKYFIRDNDKHLCLQLVRNSLNNFEKLLIKSVIKSIKPEFTVTLFYDENISKHMTINYFHQLVVYEVNDYLPYGFEIKTTNVVTVKNNYYLNVIVIPKKVE